MNAVMRWYLNFRVSLLQNQITMLQSVERSLWEHNDVERLHATEQLREKKTQKMADILARLEE